MLKNKNYFYGFIIAVVALVVLVSVILLSRQSAILKKNFFMLSLATEEGTASEISKSIETEINRSIDRLAIMAQHPDIIEGDSFTCRKYLEKVLKNTDSPVDTISRMNTDGIFNCSTSPSGIGYDGSALPYLESILSDPEHNPVISAPTLNRFREGSYFIAFHVPIFNDKGEFSGTLGSALYLDEFGSEFFDSFSRLERLSLHLIDGSSTIIYSEDAIEVGQTLDKKHISTELYDLYTNTEEGKMLTARNTLAITSSLEVDDQRWMLLLELLPNIDDPAANINSDPILLSSILFIVLVTVFALYVVIRFADKSFFTPLSNITETIVKIAGGQYGARVKISNKNNVVTAYSKLIDSINIMAKKIDDEQLSLKGSVANEADKAIEAKKALEEKVAELERLNDFMIGREIKMKELKKHIADLESKPRKTDSEV